MIPELLYGTLFTQFKHKRPHMYTHVLSARIYLQSVHWQSISFDTNPTVEQGK